MVFPSGGAIVFPVGVPGVLTVSQAVQPGEGLRIQLADADHNTDDTSIDQVVVEVENMSNPDLELVTLIETDLDTGIFTINPLGVPTPGLPVFCRSVTRTLSKYGTTISGPWESP